MTNTTCTHAPADRRAHHYREENTLTRMIAYWCHGCGDELGTLPAPAPGHSAF